VAGQDRLLAIERQVVAELGDNDVGQPAGLDIALRDRLGRQDGLGDPRVQSLGLAGPAGVNEPDEFADEDGIGW